MVRVFQFALLQPYLVLYYPITYYAEPDFYGYSYICSSKLVENAGSLWVRILPDAVMKISRFLITILLQVL